MENNPFLFIINPGAGKKKPGLRKVLQDHFRTEDEIIVTKAPGHASEITKKAIEGKATPVAVGGDGTINEVARATAGTGSPFGIIPAGSGNGLARHFKIPIKTDLALEVLRRRKTRKVDSGRVNDEFFLMTTGVGFDSQVTKRMAERKERGLSAYIKIISRTWKEKEDLPVTFKMNGTTHNSKVFIFSVSNTSQYGNGVYIAPEADDSDGLLNINVIKPFPFYAIPSLALRSLTGKNYFGKKYIERSTAPEVILRCNEKEMNIDGESRKVKMPSVIRVIKEDLKVIC
ncbi:MAG: diacylglycerol/lipid kinase family protein [Patescibacteria group bacterium]